MPTPAFLSVTGTKQGHITEQAGSIDSLGGHGQIDHPDESIVHAFSHEIISPYDAQSGEITGRRRHNAICITKVFDRASPLLLEALCRGEKLTDVVINWYRTNDGKELNYYRTTLHGALIVAIKDHMPTCDDPNNSHAIHLQDVHFTYRQIRWDHVIATSSGSYDLDDLGLD